MNGSIDGYHIYSFVVILPVFLFTYIFHEKNKNSKKYLINLLVSSALLKFCFVFIVASFLRDFNGMPFLSYNDDYVYNETAINILNVWQVRGFGFYNDVYFSTGFYSGYPNLSALAMYIFGESYYVPRFLNVVFSTWTVYYFYKTLKLENSIKVVKELSTLFAFSLTFIIYASFQLKDTILVFALSVILYNFSLFLKKGASWKMIFSVIIASILMVFFRAATLLPIAVALIVTLIFQKKSGLFSLKNLIVLSLVFGGFVFIWDYLNSINLLSFDSAGYFDNRFENTGSEESLSGSNPLSRIGPIAVILGPLYMLFSFFLPTPLAINLDPNIASLNYHFIPTIQYYALLPIGILGLFSVFKNRKALKVGFFLLIFIFIYKLGQAGSKSIFDSRQSLPAIYGLYLIAAYAISNIPHNLFNIKRNKRVINLSLVIMLIVIFSFSYFRLLIRGDI